MRVFNLFLAVCMAANAQHAHLGKTLREVRFDVHLGRDGITGGPAAVLKDAIRDSQYVWIGEDHLMIARS